MAFIRARRAFSAARFRARLAARFAVACCAAVGAFGAAGAFGTFADLGAAAGYSMPFAWHQAFSAFQYPAALEGK